MPFGDRTGPEGKGARTGLGYGNCPTTEHYYDTDYPGRIYCEYGDGKVAVGWSESLQMYVCEDHMPFEDRILA